MIFNYLLEPAFHWELKIVPHTQDITINKTIHPMTNLQTHDPGPKGKHLRPLLQSTFLCTDRKQCWHQSPIFSISRLAWLHPPEGDHTDCSTGIYNKATVSCWSKFQPNYLPVRVSVSVVITKEIIFANMLISGNLQRLVNTGQQIFTQVWYLYIANIIDRNQYINFYQVNQVGQVFLYLLGWQSSHKI